MENHGNLLPIICPIHVVCTAGYYRTKTGCLKGGIEHAILIARYQVLIPFRELTRN